jgi:hypothetical protein
MTRLPELLRDLFDSPLSSVEARRKLWEMSASDDQVKAMLVSRGREISVDPQGARKLEQYWINVQESSMKVTYEPEPEQTEIAADDRQETLTEA